MAGSDDSTLIKIAVFGITMSVLCTALIAILIADTGDYSYDDIGDYRNELVSFTGQSMVNDTPWVLTHVYTPWQNGQPVEGHLDQDGWLYGSEILDYPDIGNAANIHMDKNQKSSRVLGIGDGLDYSYKNGLQWWAGGNDLGFTIAAPNGFLVNLLGLDPYTYATGTAGNWDYTGYRYVFDPTLPFNAETSVKDGSLSLVWYSFNGQEGLSGGLQIYGGDVLLASYSATDIIAAYNSSSGYATTYDFDFNGVHLNLLIKFDQDAIKSGKSIMSAFENGNWSMAITTKSAGNFYDIENSNSFVNTAGSMIDTFIQIYTWSLPSVAGQPWMDLILWLLVGLPMTIALLCVTLRLVGSIRMVI